MAINREAVYEALRARLAAKVTLAKSVARGRRGFDAYSKGQRPFVLIAAQGGSRDAADGSPAVWTLRADVVVYVSPQPNEEPETLLHNIVDQIEAAMERQPGEMLWNGAQSETTLGGVVQRAYISSEPVEMDPGQKGDEGVALLSVEMVLPAV